MRTYMCVCVHVCVHIQASMHKHTSTQEDRRLRNATASLLDSWTW